MSGGQGLRYRHHRKVVTYILERRIVHLQLLDELLKVTLGCLLRHDVTHLFADSSDLRRLRVACLLDLVVLLLGEADACLVNVQE